MATNLSTESNQCRDAFIRRVDDELTNGCMIPIKLPKKTMLRLVDDAKKWFYRNYEDSVQECYYILPHSNFTTSTFAASRGISLAGIMNEDGSGDIISVHGLFVTGENSIGIFGKDVNLDRDFSLDKFIYGDASSSGASARAADSITYYVINEMLYDQARHVLINKISYNYNRLNKQLKIMGETPSDDVVLLTYQTIPNCDLFEDPYFFDYVVAKAKIQIGTMLTRFEMPLPGNVQINGDDIKSDGKEELENVKQEIKDDEGVDFFLHT